MNTEDLERAIKQLQAMSHAHSFALAMLLDANPSVKASIRTHTDYVTEMAQALRYDDEQIELIRSALQALTRPIESQKST